MKDIKWHSTKRGKHHSDNDDGDNSGGGDSDGNAQKMKLD